MTFYPFWLVSYEGKFKSIPAPVLSILKFDRATLPFHVIDMRHGDPIHTPSHTFNQWNLSWKISMCLDGVPGTGLDVECRF